jgi:4-coumarate--CoA ligase
MHLPALLNQEVIIVRKGFRFYSIGQDGLVIIHDRIKELIMASTKFLFMLLSNSSNRSTIQVRGTGVAPAELEDILLGHEAVKDVAVVGVPDTYSGELPTAFIVLDKSMSRGAETASMLQNFVKSKAARAKWIEGGVEFLDAIPKSASGKILRRALRERAPLKAKI